MNTDKKRIEKSIRILATKEKVWDVLFTDSYTRIWYAEFGAGSYAETDWKVGSKAIFKDDSESGLVGKIIDNEQYRKLSVEYTGNFAEGKEDYESDIAKDVKGGRETYHISENEGITYLEVECDMSPEYFEMMSEAWDNALQKIKSLAEE